MKSKSLPSILPPYTTQDVNKLSLGLGVIIGPGTVVSNVIKLVHDVAKIVFYSFRCRNYVISNKYSKFKETEKDWKAEYSAKFRPVMIAKKVEDKVIFEATLSNEHFHDQDHYNFIHHMNQTLDHYQFIWYQAKYNKLSDIDRRKVALDHAVDDALQHISSIGVGLIRTIPVVGAASILFYKNTSKTVGDPEIANSAHCKKCQVAR